MGRSTAAWVTGPIVTCLVGRSMQPTLNPDGEDIDYLLLNKIAVRDLSKVQRGKVYALVDPVDERTMLVKRVVALPGDSIKSLKTGKVTKIPPGKCWIEGDNHECAEDSDSSYGPVPIGLVRAEVPCIAWPPSRWRWLLPTLPPGRINGEIGDTYEAVQEEPTPGYSADEDATWPFIREPEPEEPAQLSQAVSVGHQAVAVQEDEVALQVQADLLVADPEIAPGADTHRTPEVASVDTATNETA
eukprot:TRINITY_DN12825_c0_g1_i1.p1 TRINITY_DN12825_c0_g1~~TRINITY_DN12825_c0_g1_i1.p1  ORF type:complete len:244 (+),score=32.00 TRINITY_DN12825_c0_g1_i1:187-918(+)